MAKKSSTTSAKINLVDLSAFIALVIAALLFIVSTILNAFDANLGDVGRILTFVKDIAVGIALSFGTWSFARRRTTAWKVLAVVAIVTYVVGLALGFSLV